MDFVVFTFVSPYCSCFGGLVGPHISGFANTLSDQSDKRKLLNLTLYQRFTTIGPTQPSESSSRGWFAGKTVHGPILVLP